MPTSVLIPANTQRNIMKSTSNDIITNNSQNINPAQITIREMLKGVKDSDGKFYYQSAVRRLGFNPTEQGAKVKQIRKNRYKICSIR